jgi:two-component system NtrC family sensor kinase
MAELAQEVVACTTSDYKASLERVVATRTKELEHALETLKRTQSELLQAQKLTAIGQLAAGVAHEINTPIQYVNDNTHFLQRAYSKLMPLLDLASRMCEALVSHDLENDLVREFTNLHHKSKIDYVRTELPKALDESLEGIRRVSSIVQALKQFSHPSDGAKQPVNLHEAIETTATLTRTVWKYVAEIHYDFDQTLTAVPCLRDEMNQVFVNLIVNAADAIGDAIKARGERIGHITIQTRREKGMAVIRVSDNGLGIPESAQSRVFLPFFTTKAVGVGTGQGLAIAYSVVHDKHGGEISFTTEHGRGTTFEIRLPL